MQYFENCRALTTVKNIVCDSITMRAQGFPRSHKWSLEIMKVVRGLVAPKLSRTNTQDIEEDGVQGGVNAGSMQGQCRVNASTREKG